MPTGVGWKGQHRQSPAHGVATPGILLQPEPDGAGDPVPHAHGFEILFRQRSGHVFVGDPVEILDRVDGAAGKGAIGEAGVEAGLFRRRRHGLSGPAVERNMVEQRGEQSPAIQFEPIRFRRAVIHKPILCPENVSLN